MKSTNKFAAEDSDDDDKTTEQVIDKRRQLNKASAQSSSRSANRLAETEAVAAATLESLVRQGGNIYRNNSHCSKRRIWKEKLRFYSNLKETEFTFFFLCNTFDRSIK